MSEQVLLVELGAFAPGREVWIPGWHSATYASAKAVSSEQQKLLMLVDECATESLSIEYIEDLELSEVELRMSHRLLKLGVCLVSQDGATLFTVHSDEADSGPALVQVCGAHHVVYKHTATSLADFQWSTVVRLLASVGILRQTRFADCGNVRILPREMVPFIYLPAMSTPLLAAVAANSPVVKLVNADESLIKKFSAFLTEQWVFGFSRHPESLFVFCHEEDAAQFKNKLAYASATIHQGQVAVQVFRFFLGPLSSFDLQRHVSLQLVQGEYSTVWHFDWDADGDQTLVEPPLVDSIALAALLGSSVSSERRDVCGWLAAISDFLRNQAAVMTVAAVGQTDALERLKAVLAFCLDHSTFSTIRCLTDHCDQSFRKTKNYCRLFSRNLSELIPQMQHIRFSFAPEVDVTFDVSFRFRPRICELLIDRLCSLPSISGQLLKSSLLQAIYMERLALAMKFVPALTMAPAREGRPAKVETERQSTGSTKDIEECSNAPAPPGKMGKFKKFTKAISSLFACLPFRKSHISVLD